MFLPPTNLKQYVNEWMITQRQELYEAAIIKHNRNYLFIKQWMTGN